MACLVILGLAAAVYGFVYIPVLPLFATVAMLNVATWLNSRAPRRVFLAWLGFVIHFCQCAARVVTVLLAFASVAHAQNLPCEVRSDVCISQDLDWLAQRATHLTNQITTATAGGLVNSVQGSGAVCSSGGPNPVISFCGQIQESQVNGLTNDLSNKLNIGAAAGGGLTGTYPSPGIGIGVVTQTNLGADVLARFSALDTSTATLSASTVTLAARDDALDLSTRTIALSTAALALRDDRLDASTATLSLSTAALATRASNLDLSTATLSLSTAAIAARVSYLDTSTAALSASTVSLAGLVSTLTVSTQALSASTATIQAYLNNFSTAGVVSGAFQTSKIASDAITTVKIITAAVQTNKIDTDAVSTAKILGGAVQTSKLATDSVTTTSIINAAVTLSKIVASPALSSCDTGMVLWDNSGVLQCSYLGPGGAGPTLDADYLLIGDSSNIATERRLSGKVAVDSMGVVSIPVGGIVDADVTMTTGAITSGAWQTAKIAADAITTSAIITAAVSTNKLATDAVSASKILGSAVQTSKLATDAVDTTKILTDSITAPKLLTAAVQTAKLASDAVDTTKILTDSVTTPKIISAAVQTGKIATDAVTNVAILTASVDTNKLASGSVDTTKLKTDSVGAFAILGGAVQTTKLGTDSVIAAAISGGAVQTTKLGTDAVTASSIQNGSVQTAKLGSDSVTTAAILNNAVTSAKTTGLSATCGTNQYAQSPVIINGLITSYASCTTISGGGSGGDVLLASTQTFSGSNTFAGPGVTTMTVQSYFVTQASADLQTGTWTWEKLSSGTVRSSWTFQGAVTVGTGTSHGAAGATFVSTVSAQSLVSLSSATEIGGSYLLVTAAQTAFGPGAPTLTSSSAYPQMNSSSIQDAGVRINRGDVNMLNSLDLITAGNTNTGWSLQMQSGGTALNIYDRISATNMMIVNHGGTIGFGGGLTSSGLVSSGDVQVTGNLGVTSGNTTLAGGNVEVTSGTVSIDGTNGGLNITSDGGKKYLEVHNSGLVSATDGIVVRKMPSTYDTSGRTVMGIGAGNPLNYLDVPSAAFGTYAGSTQAANGTVIIGANLGINQVAPQAKLHVSSGTIMVDGNAATAFQVGASTFMVLGSGNILVGSNANDAVAGALQVDGNVRLRGASAGAATIIEYGNNTSSDKLTLRPRNNEVGIVFDANYQLGIGVTSPNTPLDLLGAFQIHRTANSARVSTVTMESGALDIMAESAGAYPIRFYTGNSTALPSERVRIDATGNIGIGTTAPSYALDVSNAAGSGFVGRFLNTTAATANSGLRIGVGPNSSDTTSVLISFVDAGINTTLGTITRNGSAAVAYNTSSDRRIKRNIVPMSDGLAKLMTLRPSEYDMVGGDHHAGLIAQEVYAVYPEAVTTNGDDGEVALSTGPVSVWSIDYGRLTPLLIKAVQDQQALINDLQARVADLEKNKK